MSGISSGIGLVSGIDSAGLIDQLIAIERRPLENLQARVSAIEVQRAAFLELSAQLLAVQNSTLAFGRGSFFRRFGAASTNEGALTATAGETAAPGSYTFQVRSLVSNHSLISRGFADADTTPVGTGSLAIEVGHGRVDPSTPLEVLRGGAGIRRGVITITDRSGASADVDLTTALNVADVLEAINGNTAIDVQATVTGVSSNGAAGDRMVIEDLSGGTGNLTIVDNDGGYAATDLGIAASVAGDRIDGADIIRLSESTPLSLLNDGNGVGRFDAGPDLDIRTALGQFTVSLSGNLVHQLDTDLRILNSGNGVRLGTVRITDRTGASSEVDLSAARTVRNVIDTINAADVSVSATVVQINDDSFFQIVDTSDIPEEADNAARLIIEDVTGHTAADLGLAQEAAGTSIQGSSVYRIETLGDVINAINYAQGNNSFVQASISADGNALTLRALGLDNTLTVTAGQNSDGSISTAASDLGLLGADNVEIFESRPLMAGLETVLLHSLNGGAGVQLGEVSLTDRAGQTTTVDLTAARTLQDVIDLINLDGTTSLAASVNGAGNGIELRDRSDGAGMIVIEDVSGTTAADLSIAGTFDPDGGNVIRSGNLQRQYISRQTLLSELNGGRGVTPGTFRVSDSAGAVHTIVLDDLAVTVGDVIDAVNRFTPDTIEARINDTGDGIVVVDTAGGSLPLTIEDIEGGRAAADLRLAGTARAGQVFLDGSFEFKIEIDASDTLQDILAKINQAGGGFSASLFNHGGSVNPYSLTIASEVTGRAGELVVDAQGLDLGLTTLSEAQDAIITVGDGSSSTSRLVSSSSNTIDDAIDGVTLNLLSVTEEPVTVTVAQDVDGIVEAIQKFVDDYNTVLDTIHDQTSFNPDTLERGPLLGDPTINLVRDRLQRLMTRKFDGGDESMSRLFSVGLRVRDGNRLQFDEEQFRQIYGESPEAVERLFGEEGTGFAAVAQEVFEELTRDFDGLLSRKADLLSDQQELLNNRIDDLSVLLEAKRARLEAQFVALESTLAALQNQQTALSTLAQLASGSAL